MGIVGYHYPRALELEGRHPADAGCWPVSIHRLEIGEGLPSPDTAWAHVSVPDGGPIPKPERPPAEVLWHNFYYRRLRSSTDCDNHIRLFPENLVRPAFQMTADWADPPDGVIPIPSPADRLIPHSHSVRLIGRLPEDRRFRFRLLWKDWGDNSTGTMPFEYFDRYVFECWATYGNSALMRVYIPKRLQGEGLLRWTAHDEEDHRIYGFEVQDKNYRERRAWAFVVERDGALEVEEIYVRPEYRRLGHGRWLADRVAQLARDRKMPLRLWVAFADCRSEAASNYAALAATARRLGVQFLPSPVAWAAYFGTTERPGSDDPIEPPAVPRRPRMPRQELLAAVLALGLGSLGAPVEPRQESAVAVHQPESGLTPGQSDIEVGSEAWLAVTQRRAELIFKKNRDGLTESERAEFDRLQQISRATIAKKFGSAPATEAISALAARLGLGGDGGRT
jgi:GNAT superfamily N-acetyltransferase